jgi:eukaryotic-like serine/threonine-protein kinase
MGEVYRARDERLGREIALKILSPELSSSSEHLLRFEQEARAASALNHPNIITIYDIGNSAAIGYIAMELVQGEDLRSLLAGGALPLKQALRIAVKIADGLAAAHERGIVHRDLKPGNVMVTQDGFVKILDFGLAKLAKPFSERDSTMPRTAPGAVLGTVGYMSPEQASGRDVDFHTDQFALGVILYEMLSGHMPFSERSAAETLAAIIRKEPPPITTFNDELPPELVRIIGRLLAKEPRERYASTRDLARDLREIRDGFGSTSSIRHPSGFGVPPKRRPGIMVAIGAVLLIAATAAMIMMRSEVAPSEPVDSGRVAVLPFLSKSGTPDQQIFADGLAEIISTRLQRSGMDIVEMFSTSRNGGGNLLRKALGRGASTAVRGEVSRSNGDLSVTYSVLNTSTGRVLATNTITGPANLLELEPRVVDGIRQSLNLQPASSDASAAFVTFASAEDHNAYVDALGLLQRARDEKSVEQAIETLQKLLLNARDSAMVNAQLARAFLYKSQMSRRPELVEQATIYAERAVALDGDAPETRTRLGQLRLEAGRYTDAETEFRKALTLRRNDPDATLGLAVSLEKLGYASEAERMYQKAISLRPDHGPTYNVYATFLFNHGRHEDAAVNYRRFTELMPTARGFSNLSEAYRALGRYDDAQRAAKESVAMEQTTDGYCALGDVYFYSGRLAEARQTYQTAVALSSSNYKGWIGLGRTLRASGAAQKSWTEAYEKALATAQETISVNPRDAAARAVAAIALIGLGRAEEGATESKAALKVDPTEKMALYAAAVVARERGAANTAVTWLDGAVRAGYPVSDLLRDPEFQTLKDDPGFRRVVQQ